LQFEEQRDAEDAIHGRDGYDFDGYRLRVGIFILIDVVPFLSLFYSVPQILLAG